MEFIIFYSPAYYVKMILSTPTYNIYHLHTATVHTTYKEFDKVQNMNCRWEILSGNGHPNALVNDGLKIRHYDHFLQEYRLETFFKDVFWSVMPLFFAFQKKSAVASACQKSGNSCLDKEIFIFLTL